MPWPIRSRLLFQEIAAAPGANTVRYTPYVPSGKTWLVKDVVFWNGGAGGQNFYLYWSNGSLLIVVMNFLAVANGGNGSSAGRSLTVPSGFRLAWSASMNSLTHVTISGAQLG